jgi:thiopeptide-type bacteriocin biosynthesis protein
MSELQELFTVVSTTPERMEPVLRALVLPVVRDVREHPDLDTLFYGLFSHPRDEVRFRIQGKAAWIRGAVRERLTREIEELSSRGWVHGHEMGRYRREVDRFGGEEGMRLTERIYHHDSLACLDFLALEEEGGAMRSRRELAVAVTERVLDALRLEGEGRIGFYTFAARWPAADGDWTPEDHAALDKRYAELADGLLALTTEPEASVPPVEVWGGEAAARIGARYLASLTPVLEEARAAHAAGRIRQDLVYLAWSWTHMHCNRLGISAVQEGILRQLLLRHHRRHHFG